MGCASREARRREESHRRLRQHRLHAAHLRAHVGGEQQRGHDHDTLRSRGYGKQLLAQILTRAPLTILEIDPLTTAIAHKRLRFYQSMGFHANPWAHHHPSYHQGIADHELLVLSYPQPIDERQYQQFARDLGHEVMGRE